MRERNFDAYKNLSYRLSENCNPCISCQSQPVLRSKEGNLYNEPNILKQLHLLTTTQPCIHFCNAPQFLPSRILPLSHQQKRRQSLRKSSILLPRVVILHLQPNIPTKTQTTPSVHRHTSPNHTPDSSIKPTQLSGPSPAQAQEPKSQESKTRLTWMDG
jgi:hypothetical protein